MPSHDETSPVGSGAGPVRRPPPARPGGGGRGRTTASRAGSSGSGGNRPPGNGSGGGRSTGSGGGRGGRGGKGKPVRTKKQRRRRRLKIVAGVLAGMFVLLAVFVGVVYATTDVPDPSSVQNAQTTVVYYADGTTEMARLGDENRTNVSLDEVSEPARNAILAAENRNFYSDPGISFTGIVRAAWNNLTGGSTQGGSTITQQYVKNAFLTSEQTFSRKFQELFLAIKLDNEYSKDEIFENYLNTIYFGRGAYGIEAAANTFFGVPASALTAEQGAALAVLIRNPSNNDPEVNPDGALSRWEGVMDAMEDEGWVTSAERSAAVYPPVLPRTGSNLGIPGGPEGLVVQQALAELRAKGYTDQQIYAGGLRITTTIAKPVEDAAITAVNDVMQGEPGNLRQALVAIDPRTGAVVAYYGGPNGTGNDYAQAQRQPGSSMKPYVLATALEQGIGVESRRDGSSPQTFPDRPGQPVRNSGGASCGNCTLVEAMTRSLNTTFYGLAYEVGADNVRTTALAATGLPDTWQGGGLDGQKTLANADGFTGASIGIGEYEMRPIDQAHGFATLAAGGVERSPYFVSRVTDTSGAVLLEYGGDPGDQVIPADVANDTTFALEGVADYSRRPLDDDRPVASKTGTQGLNDQDNSDAWMVGYTPSLSTAVWMGTDGRDPIVNAEGRIIYGAGLPGAIWQEFMDAVLAGTPEEPLPDEPVIDADRNGPPATETEAPETTSAAPQTTQAAPQTTQAAPTTTAPAPTTSAAPTTSTPAETSDPLLPTEVVPPTGPAQGGPAQGGAAAPGNGGNQGNGQAGQQAAPGGG